MKKLVDKDVSKTKRAKKRTNERGSVTLFVLIAMIFFLTVGIAVYITNMNSSISQQREVGKIQNEYQDGGSPEDVYEQQKEKLGQKLFFKVYDEDGNVYEEDTWTQKKLTVEVQWPDGVDDSKKKIVIEYEDGRTETVTGSDANILEGITDNCTVTATVEDEEYSTHLQIDKTAPKVSYRPDGGIKLRKEGQTCVLQTNIISQDNQSGVSESGVKTIEYAWSDTPEQPASGWKTIEIQQTDTEQITVERQVADEINKTGEFYLWAKSTDCVGNTSAIVQSKKFTVITYEEALETIKIEHTPTNWLNSEVTVTVDYGSLFTETRMLGIGKTLEEAQKNRVNKTEQKLTFTAKQNEIIYVSAMISGNYESERGEKNHEITNIDKLNPDVTITSVEPKVWTNDGITVSFTAKDKDKTVDYGCSGIVGWQISKQKDLTASSTGWKTEGIDTATKTIKTPVSQKLTENGTYYIYVKDEAGNVNIIDDNGDGSGSGDDKDNGKIVVEKVDKVKPTITATPDHSEVCKTINVKVDAIDEGGSQLASDNVYQYQVSKSNTEVPTGNWLTYENGKQITIGDKLTGTYYLWIKEVKDIAGNISEKNGTKVSTYHVFGKYIFDNTPPVISANNITFGETLSIHLTDADSKVKWWNITTTNQSPADGWQEIKPESADVTVTKSSLSATTYYIWARDIFGNESSKSVVVNPKNLSSFDIQLNKIALYMMEQKENQKLL